LKFAYDGETSKAELALYNHEITCDVLQEAVSKTEEWKVNPQEFLIRVGPLLKQKGCGVEVLSSVA
jgi:hypothetical protein